VRKQIFRIFFLTVLAFTSSFTFQTNQLTDYVDPFIGTDGFGHTFPGASLPFGMIQLSPDTRTSGWENCSGYHSANPTIIGFSHTHLSGTGAIDYGDILIAPTTGKLQTAAGDEQSPATGYRSAFRHETEQASPGYYSVLLDDHRIKAELTATERAGLHRYTFPKSEEAHVILDLLHGLGDKVIESAVEIIGDTRIEGMRRSRGWAEDQHIYFSAELSKPFESFGIVAREAQKPGERQASGKNVKAFVNFSTQADEAVLIKVGISAVNVEGARKNLRAEIADWDFDRVRRRAAEKWNQSLGRIRVEGGSGQEKVNFYTALYHAMLSPNLFTDVDGKYRGGDRRVHQAEGREVYTVFSLWDTFRAAHPLFAIIEPKRDSDFIKTLISKHEEGGLLPVWELAANETGTMIGYHSVPVIVDAYMKGIRDFDVALAFEAMKKSAEQDHLGLKYYRRLGYIPADKENESVSKTLEYAYDDWCIAQMALALGKTADYGKYIKRAARYINVYDASTGFMRGKKAGNWVKPFDPNEVSGIYTEANAWQYTFFAPQDVEGLIDLMGGDSRFIERVDKLFSARTDLTGRSQPDISGMVGQYAHGNEPSHHMAYLYSYAGAPWKTEERVRQIMEKFYTNARDGLCGNEDCGQMSAWYNFSAMGFYPVCPGSDIYVLGSPIFEKVVIDVGRGKKFTIRADGVSKANKYIQSARLGGKPYTKSFIRHTDITGGGELVFQMGDKPDRDRGVRKEDRPRSLLKEKFVMNPFFVASERAFLDSNTVELKCYTPESKIYYTLDGSMPSMRSKLYTSPITLMATTTIKAIAIKDGTGESSVEEVEYIKIPYRRTISYKYPYSHLYTAGGRNGLLDFERGETNAFGSWQGFEGTDLDAVVDLGERRRVSRISAGFLQNYPSWIFLPASVEYFISDDGKEFTSLGVINNTIPQDQEGAFVKEFEVKAKDATARFVRVVAKNIGVCPPWHLGAGQKCWVFVDEVVIE
jgi:predicted alpha-1,2-mannosidase